MDIVATECPECKNQTLSKLPSFFNSNKEEKANKTGDIVHSSINEFSEDLKKQKEELKNEYCRKDK